MGVADQFRPSAYSRNILLIGDSIVSGGNPVDQEVRLGPVMNTACPRVWPVAAGSWAFLNELRYLRTHDYLLPTFNRIVFVLNSEDFDEASVWASEYTHPTHRPLLTSVYIVQKKFASMTGAAKRGDNDWRAEFLWLRQQYHGLITIALYPTKAEAADSALRAAKLNAHMTELQARDVEVIEAINTPAWSPADYRDDIHPTIDGTKKLANYIVSKLPECFD
jgi:hypothetical protein